MNYTIYVDVLFLLNLTVDYIILSSSALLTGRHENGARLLLAAAFGALYSAIVFFPKLALLNIVFFRILASVVILLIGFRFINIYSFAKLFAVYYIVSAAYGGGMYAFYHFTALGTRINASNGVYYIDLPLWAVIVLAFAFYYLTKLFARLSADKDTAKRIRKVNVTLPGGEVTLDALYDTGNTLYDPITLLPVMIAETGAFEGVLQKRLLDKAGLQLPDLLPELHDEYPELKLRIVPFKDITGKKSCVYAFKANKVTDESGKPLPQMLIGLTGTVLSADGRFNALLHSKL